MLRFPLLILIVLGGFKISLSQEWQFDLNHCKKIAAEKEQPIIIVFQGSDWCAPCIKLDKEVWSTEIFKSFAAENYVMLKADFPRRKKNALPKEQAQSNAELAERYNKEGIFPLAVVLDEDGNVLGKTGYKKKTPMAYIEELNSFIK